MRLAKRFENREKDARIACFVEATAGLGGAIRRIMLERRILEGVVQNKYANNPGKLAASASHIEKAPKKSTSTP